MSSIKSIFYSLPTIHQRALHELWLNRNDSNFVVSEETKPFREENQQVLREEFDVEFKRQPFTLGQYSKFTDSSGVEILLYKDPSKTPPPDYSSSEEEYEGPFSS
jgi:glycogen synthase